MVRLSTESLGAIVLISWELPVKAFTLCRIFQNLLHEHNTKFRIGLKSALCILLRSVFYDYFFPELNSQISTSIKHFHETMVISWCRLKYHQYVDNTQLHISVLAAQIMLLRCFPNAWKQHGLRFNIYKTKWLGFLGSSTSCDFPSLILNGVIIWDISSTYCSYLKSRWQPLHNCISCIHWTSSYIGKQCSQ